MTQILNVEFKAKAKNLFEIKNKLINLKAKDGRIDHQIDIYFNTANGRLKLRKGEIENSLIFYNRKDQAGPRESKIVLEKLIPGNSLEKVLEISNGVKVVVDKKRQIYFIDNVKFHLDTVEGLGTYFEIEAIQDSSDNTAAIKNKLEKQCAYYLDLFNISSHDFISLSYSDLIIEKKLYEEAQEFLSSLEKNQKILEIDIFKFPIDHLCYRVENIFDYYYKKEIFAKLGELLIESEVGGRLIATYKLNRPIEYQGQKIFLIELPAPKKNSHYNLGFEHAEVVISHSFKQFMNNYPHLNFDLSALDKKFNPEIRLNLALGVNVKFHHQSLEEVILIEQKTKSSMVL